MQGERDVILISVVSPYVPVAKATLKRTSPATVVQGTPLGSAFCEVAVKYVLKRDALLPRPVGDINKMIDAYGLSIAWPRTKVLSPHCFSIDTNLEL